MGNTAASGNTPVHFQGPPSGVGMLRAMSALKVIALIVCSLLACAGFGAAIYAGVVLNRPEQVPVWLAASAVPGGVIYSILRNGKGGGGSMPPSPPSPIALLVWPILMSAMPACGGPPAAVQTSLTTTARAVVALDDELAPAYAEAADECRDASSSWDAYDVCLAEWETARTALGATHRSLLSAQAAHDAWEDGADEGAGFAAIVPCLARAIGQALDALELVGLEPPDLVGEALALVTAFGGACRE